MLWPAIYMAHTMAQANALTFVVALASRDSVRMIRGLWSTLDFWDPQIGFLFYLTWWYMALRWMRDQFAAVLGVNA